MTHGYELRGEGAGRKEGYKMEGYKGGKIGTIVIV